MIHEFTLVVQTPFDPGQELTAWQLDRLYNCSCSDATITERGGCVYFAFAREAATREEAIEAAVADVKEGGFEASLCGK